MKTSGGIRSNRRWTKGWGKTMTVEHMANSQNKAHVLWDMTWWQHKEKNGTDQTRVMTVRLSPKMGMVPPLIQSNYHSNMSPNIHSLDRPLLFYRPECHRTSVQACCCDKRCIWGRQWHCLLWVCSIRSVIRFPAALEYQLPVTVVSASRFKSVLINAEWEACVGHRRATWQWSYASIASWPHGVYKYAFPYWAFSYSYCQSIQETTLHHPSLASFHVNGPSFSWMGHNLAL